MTGEIIFNEHQVVFEKRGGRHKVPPELLSGPAAVRAARAVKNAITRGVAREGVVEVPGTRRRIWEYREACLVVDPREIAAYVGDLTGAAAVKASDEFLARLADGIEVEEL